MTGLPRHNYPAFMLKATDLRVLGVRVLNPAEHFGGDRSLARTEYLEADARDILEADAIVVMEGWERSKGAQWEIDFARGIGRPVGCEKCFASNLRANWADQRALNDAVECFKRQWAKEQEHVARFGLRGPNNGPEDAPEGSPTYIAKSIWQGADKPGLMSMSAAMDAYGGARAERLAEQQTLPFAYQALGVVESGSVVMGIDGNGLVFGTPSGWTTKDSGVREEMPTGSRRDSRVGKGRYDLFPPAALRRVAGVNERGAVKYGERNIERGQPISRLLDSALRHLYQYLAGDRDEDHLAQAAWNALWATAFDEDRPDLQDIPAQRAAQGLDEQGAA